MTTTALATTLLWPRPAMLVEADVSGSSSVKAGHFRGQVGAQPNIGQLVVAYRAGRLDADAVRRTSIELPLNPSRTVIPGLMDASQRADLTTGFWVGLGEVVSSIARHGVDVIIDAGRLGMAHGPGPLIDAADLVAVVSRTRLDDVVSVAANAAMLRGHTDVAVDRVGLVLVGAGRPVSAASFTQTTGLPVWANIAFDPVHADQLSGAQEIHSAKKLSVSALMRSVRTGIAELDKVAARRAELLEDCDDPAPASADAVLPADVDDGADDDCGVVGLVRTTAGIGAVLSAGLIGVLTARRALQQCHRRYGQRLPTPAVADVRAEVELRHVADSAGVELVDRALRILEARMAERRQALPAIRMARLMRGQVEIHLAAPARGLAPFVGSADGMVWTFSSDAGAPDHVMDAWLGPGPYPGLVCIGHDVDDAHVLLDLEHVGMLHVTGDEAYVQAFMNAVAAEYATGRWADDILVSLVGADNGLGRLQTGRIRYVEDVDQLLRVLTSRAHADRDLLVECGAASVSDARLRRVAEAAWTPEIVLAARPLAAAQR